MSKEANHQIFDSETITLAQLRRVLETLKGSPGSTKITMTYMCSLFPNAWKNFEKNMHQVYLSGYKAGYEDGQNDIKESN